MKNNLEQFWRLNSPSMCRDFLKQIRLDGKEITVLTQADGKNVSIDEAADEAIMDLARELAHSMSEASK